MVEAFQNLRMIGFILLLLVSFGVLAARLYYIQVTRHPEWLKRARQNTERSYIRWPHRGEIRDRYGRPLAVSLPVKSVSANPNLIHEGRRAEMAQVLSPWLEMDEPELADRLHRRFLKREANGKAVYDGFVSLKPKVGILEWEEIERGLAAERFGFAEHGLNPKQHEVLRHLRTKAIRSSETETRLYLSPLSARPVIGYVGVENSGAATVGVDGIENWFDPILRGAFGRCEIEVDVTGRELPGFRKLDLEARDGMHVVLSLDSELQEIAESELSRALERHRPASASAVMIRPHTGEVLAMATLPAADPGNFESSTNATWQSRSVTEAYEPGSTLKIITIAAALNEHLVTLEDRVYCENGLFKHGRATLRDDHPHGLLTVEEVLAKSSNIGAAKIAILLGPERLRQYLIDFGFGQLTGISLPGEASGLVHPLERWNDLSITRVPMGHEISVTTLQSALAMSAIANGGRLMQPILVDRLEDPQGRVAAKARPRIVRHVISERTSELMTAALQSAVSKAGTGYAARLEQYSVAGKTGTAQKSGPRGYAKGRYISSFIGFFPADAPELCLAVVIDEPRTNGYYGAATAAPIFKRMAERAAKHLHLLPDAKRPPTSTSASL